MSLLKTDYAILFIGKNVYIQVAYLLTDQKTIEREFGALEKIRDNYPKMVLSMDKYLAHNRNGIDWMNLVDFLQT